MTFDEFSEYLSNSDDYKRLIELRGGCSCHLSPPCFACSEPLTEYEAERLGWERPEERFRFRNWRME